MNNDSIKIKGGKRAPSFFKGDLSQQSKEIINFHLGNYGMKESELIKIFSETQKKYDADQSKGLNFSHRQTMKKIMKDHGYKNFTEYNQPLDVVKTQKELLISLRGFMSTDNYQNMGTLIEIFDEYIQSTKVGDTSSK